MKKRVSRNIRTGRLLIIPVIIILAIINVDALLNTEKNNDGTTFIILPVITLFILLINYIIFKYLDKSKTIEYDDKHLYITDKFETKTVPLESVLTLKMTAFQLNKHFGWKLTYKDKDNVEMFVDFFPRLLNVNLADFGKEIIKNNPDAKIQKFNLGPFQIDKVDN